MSTKSGQIENPLRKYLEDKDLKIREFSRLSSIPYSSLQDIVSGHTNPRKKMITKICKATHFSITLEDFGLN